MALVDPHKIFLAPLHIKLEFIENFVKAMARYSEGFQYLKDRFENKKTADELKTDIFVGPGIQTFDS